MSVGWRLAGRTDVLSVIRPRLGLAREQLDASEDTLPFRFPETILLSSRLAVQLKSVGRENVLSNEKLKNHENSILRFYIEIWSIVHKFEYECDHLESLHLFLRHKRRLRLWRLDKSPRGVSYPNCNEALIHVNARNTLKSFS